MRALIGARLIVPFSSPSALSSHMLNFKVALSGWLRPLFFVDCPCIELDRRFGASNASPVMDMGASLP
jgi:hypothetical protein